MPADEVFAISNAYKEDEIPTLNSKENTDSGYEAGISNGADNYENDDIFEVRDAHPGDIKNLVDELQLSVSSISSVSSIQLGEEASGSQCDAPTQGETGKPTEAKNQTRKSSSNEEARPKTSVFRRKSLYSVEPTSKSIPQTSPSQLGPSSCSIATYKNKTKRGRNSVTSVHVLAKYKLKQDRKAAFTITLLIALFVVFKVPYSLALLFNAFQGKYWVTVTGYEALTWLYWAKSLTNPFVYAFISKRFRAYCVKLFQRLRGVFRRKSYSF